MYALVDSSGKRVRKGNELTPVFQYPAQALKYIEKHLGGSNAITLRKLRLK